MQTPIQRYGETAVTGRISREQRIGNIEQEIQSMDTGFPVSAYAKNARNFLEKQPTSTTQSIVSSEGTYFRYDTATNEFGIMNKYGGVSSYFKPGTRLDYWLDQISKYAIK